MGLAGNKDSWMVITYFLWLIHTWKIKSWLNNDPFLFWNASFVSVMFLRGHMTAILYSREIQKYLQLHTQCVCTQKHILILSHKSMPVSMNDFPFHFFGNKSCFLNVYHGAKPCAKCFACETIYWTKLFYKKCDRKMQPVLRNKTLLKDVSSWLWKYRSCSFIETPLDSEAH